MLSLVIVRFIFYSVLPRWECLQICYDRFEQFYYQFLLLEPPCCSSLKALLEYLHLIRFALLRAILQLITMSFSFARVGMNSSAGLSPLIISEMEFSLNIFFSSDLEKKIFRRSEEQLYWISLQSLHHDCPSADALENHFLLRLPGSDQLIILHQRFHVSDSNYFLSYSHFLVFLSLQLWLMGFSNR